MDPIPAERLEATALASAGADGTIHWAGVGFAEMLGLAADNVVGPRLHDLFGKAAPWSGHAFDLAVSSMSRQVSRIELALDGGGVRLLKLSFEPAAPAGGAALSVIILAQDVTGDTGTQVQAERYQVLFKQSHDGILYGTESGPILEANPAACQILGASAEELRSMRRQDVTDLTDPRLPERLAERRRNGTARGVLTMIRKDGSRFECELSSSVWRAANGEMESVTLMRDMTERHALELKVRELQRLESLGILAGGLARDFNNIVAAIIGNVVLARAEEDSGRPTHPMLEEIDKSAERARLLVEHLMVFGQKRQQNLEVQALQPVLERGVVSLQTMLPAAIQVRQTFSTESLHAKVDAGGFIQALINLGVNSSQAMPVGRGIIDIMLDRVDLEYAEAEKLGGTSAGAYARIRVRDDGIGFDDAIRERIFDPFFTTRQMSKGTGMGLALVHSIVRDHGGMITATGNPGLGAEFTIHMPLVQPVAALLPPPATRSDGASSAAGRGRRIFYIDDDEALVTLVCILLERAGFKVRGFTDPEEALRALEVAPDDVDMVLTDFNMPGVSGLDVARASAQLRPDLPVAIVSGYVTDELREQAAALGVRAVLYKETSVRDFCATIGNLLDANQPKSLAS